MVQKFVMVVVACAALLMASPARALDCTPTFLPAGGTAWSPTLPADYATAPGNGIELSTNEHHIFSPAVPAGKMWIFTNISLSTNYGDPADYMIEHLTLVPNGYVMPEIYRGNSRATPALNVPSAFLRFDPFMPGDRIGWRANVPAGAKIFGMWKAVEFPVECYDRVMLFAPFVVEGASTSTPPPDLTAVLQALQDITTAADAIKLKAADAAQSLP